MIAKFAENCFQPSIAHFFFTFLIREDKAKPTEAEKTKSTTDGKCSREKRT